MDFIRFKKYDNSARVRDIQFMKNSISCWAVPEELTVEFLKIYADAEPEILDVQDKALFAYDYELVDRYVTSIEEMDEPIPEVFESNHCVTCEKIKKHSHLSIFDVDIVPYFETPYQVILKNKDDQDVLNFLHCLEKNRVNSLIEFLLDNHYGYGGLWEATLLASEKILVNGNLIETVEDLFEFIENECLQPHDRIQFTFVLSFNDCNRKDKVLVCELINL